MNPIKLLMFFLVLVGLFPGEAPAATVSIQDTTLVQPWYRHSTAINAGFSALGWRDIVAANPSRWDIKQVDVTWSSGGNLLLEIYTNYPQTRAGLAGAGQADIALDCNRDGIFETGIVMRGSSANIGKIYNVTSWKTSEALWQGSWIYAGRYASQDDLSNRKAPLTVIKQVDSLLGRAHVTVDSLPPGSLTLYRVKVELPQGFNETGQWNDFDFLVYSGSCGNETLAGTAIDPVPIPPALVLFGSGLLGLGLARKWTGLFSGKGED